MKTIRKVTILLILVFGLIGVTPQKATAQGSVSFQLFYDNLSPYGNWINNSNYGYVWVPDVPYGFAPYSTNGYWVYTEMGWTWVSNYSWGWAPFHYGRWFYDSYYGWVWVPDTYWGPAWVNWRYSDGYYGWAAIGPGSGYNVPHNHWVFVRERDFGRRNISNYYVNVSNNTTIINHSKVINNIHTDQATRVKYNAGPNKVDVQQRSKATFTKVDLKERSKPGQSISGNKLQLYKPRVEKSNNDNKRPVPAKVMQQNDVKSITERRGVAQPNKEMRKENLPQIKQPSRELENQERKIIPQQRKAEMPIQRSVPNAKKQEIQQRVNEPALEQRDMRTQRNELPIQLQRNVPQIRQEVLQQPGNNMEQRIIRKKPD